MSRRVICSSSQRKVVTSSLINSLRLGTSVHRSSRGEATEEHVQPAAKYELTASRNKNI